jgi:uncharacterized UPF0160 family protein
MAVYGDKIMLNEKWTIEDLKEFILKEFTLNRIDANDKRYCERFTALEKKLDTAIQTQTNSVKVAFETSQKAIDKSEVNQTSYNQAHNDLSKKMENLITQLVSKTEYQANNKTITDKIDGENKDIALLRENFPKEISGLRVELMKEISGLRVELMKEISGLRESRSQGQGKGIGLREGLGYIIAAITVIGFLLSKYHT